MDKNVAEFKAAIAHLLAAHPEVLPFGNTLESVEVLAGKRGGKLVKRQDKSDTPSPRGDAIFITLRPAAPAPGRQSRAGSDARPASRLHAADSITEDQLADLTQALHRAESEPGHSFVALKWFRDTYLQRQGFSWADLAEARDQVLRIIISRGWVRVDKIPNPRHPAFPTSVLRLQRTMPEVQNILGEPPKLGWDFQPMPLRGEPISQTLRRMRDEGY